MLKIFISHAWEDKAVARRLADCLKRDGVDVWIDYEKISGGDSLPKRIGEALKWCDTLLLLWSKSAQSSYYVNLEWETALDLQKRIILCSLDHTDRPIILHRLLFLQFLDFIVGYNSLSNTLDISTQERKLEKPTKTSTKVLKPPRFSILHAKRSYLFVIAAAFIAIIGFVALTKIYSLQQERRRSINTTIADKFLSDTNWFKQFNDAQYDSVITELPLWLAENNILPQRQGVPLYFLAESYYNLGLSSSSSYQSQISFHHALANFEEALTRADLALSDYRNQAHYKKGWTYFRLAELGYDNPEQYLQAAYSSFTQFDKNASQQLIFSNMYMAGESSLRRAVLGQYRAFCKETTVSDVNEIFRFLADAEKQFVDLLENRHLNHDLKIAALIRLNDIYYHQGKIYQGLDAHLIGSINDGKQRRTVTESAKYYLSKSNYEAIAKKFNSTVPEEMIQILKYSDAITFLSVYMLQKDNYSALAFSDRIGALEVESFLAEKLFRLANFAQVDADIEQDELYKLSSNDGLYAQSSTAIPEAFFWLGLIQVLLGNDRAHDNFINFIKNAPSAAIRQRMLIDEAKLRIFVLEHEDILQLSVSSEKAQQLKSLANEVISFLPRAHRLQTEKDKLLLRINLSMEIERNSDAKEQAASIYNNILYNETGNASSIIKDIIRQSVSVENKSKLYYIKILEPLLSIFEAQRPLEALFYRGIIESLKAEISPSFNDRQQLFLQSAKLMSGVEGIFQEEAHYVQARSLLFAQSYNEAIDLLTNLIDKNKSIRALFHLGEIYRILGNGLAARQCFQVVKDKTQNLPDGCFWYDKASEALLICDSSGSINALQHNTLIQVQFPDILAWDEDGNSLSYEELADKSYLFKKQLETANKLLADFSLPKRSLYPTDKVLANSQFVAEGIFEFRFLSETERR